MDVSCKGTARQRRHRALGGEGGEWGDEGLMPQEPFLVPRAVLNLPGLALTHHFIFSSFLF